MYWIQKRLLSQNFLYNRQLVKQLIRDSSIGKNDTVLEIGAGKGIITQELLEVSKQVLAIELDNKLMHQLRSKFEGVNNLKLIQENFLKVPLPDKPYKVFSNIPFSITGEVIRKLLQSPHPLQDAYLVVQSEAASKFVANPKSNTMAAILYYPWWDIQVVHRFLRSDFSPPPKVDSVLLRIQRRNISLIPATQKALYQDLVAYHFSKDRFAKFAPPSHWLKLSTRSKLVTGSFSRLKTEQGNLQKIHRTRTDPNWRKFARMNNGQNREPSVSDDN